MGAALLPGAAFGIRPFVINQPFICRRTTSFAAIRNRNCFFAEKRISRPFSIVYSGAKDSDDSFSEAVVGQDGHLGRSEATGLEDELTMTKKALVVAQAKQDALEKERDQLLEKLAQSEAKKPEYMSAISDDNEVAIPEVEAAKSLFQKALKESVEERFALESKLVLAKQDAIDLAVQVEKLAEIAFHQATIHILQDAQLKISSAETTAAEGAHLIEKRIMDATESTVSSIVEKSEFAIGRALAIAEEASEHAKKTTETLIDNASPFDQIASVQAENMKLQGIISDLESQLIIARNEVNGLKLEVEQTRQQQKAFEQRAIDAERALLDFKESTGKNISKQVEEIKTFMKKMKIDVTKRTKAVSKTFKTDLKNIKTTVEAAKQMVRLKDYAYLNRFKALQRSLKASEDALRAWRQRTEMAESFLLRESRQDEGDADSIYVVNGGRIDLLKTDDSQKWKLLSDGPRTEIPQWMARRIQEISTKFPPRKIGVAEAMTSKFRPLELPKEDEVWSIAQEKPKQGDALDEHIERETLEKKRNALETALKRKATQLQGDPEQTKLESATGTGREIVFQAFNWESWRRQWYSELASKSTDLSQAGITAVWLPPPTQSVAPQGYMPSDLYNLNSSYGTVEDLKSCIQEMHSQDLVVLGDVVLNHRCAQKQSPNGVWNIYDGKLAWGPEAIVCDDPNFEGRGNPSTGDIFHAAPNIDHSQDFVRKDIKEWLKWLRSDIGYDGWRLDFVRGFSGTYVKEYIEASNPVFSIGEYWDAMKYEHGTLCYNQDAHRQRIVDWVNATGGTSAAFDMTTKGILHSALHGEYWRLIDPQGKPPGVMGWWPSRAVTFVENHDTGSTQGHWPFPRDKLMQGYAYILTHAGTPTIFYDHFYDFGIRDVITELIEARKRGGIHCRSPTKIFHANNEGYVARVGDSLVLKLGHFAWHPSRENLLDGSWKKFIDKKTDYQVWLRE
ncbi:uncharacterized protein LOC107486262 [Arachis duranensis]|uniref:alpha-amylase n=1 Tax=Arachis duranensis TaxID=130453 RepID=A0A9C6WSY1_ARADU|nr:uncharacterized protein LOC107486262 [Arachis duranensis]